MQYLNAYTPPQASPEPPKNVHLHTPPSSYDLNFSGGPIPSLPLQTDKVALIPLIPSLHGPQLFSEFAGATKRGEVKEGWLRWMPYARDIERSLDDLLYVIETQQRAVPVSSRAMFLCAISLMACDMSLTVDHSSRHAGYFDICHLRPDQIIRSHSPSPRSMPRFPPAPPSSSEFHGGYHRVVELRQVSLDGRTR
jgi:hypothetical protein